MQINQAKKDWIPEEQTDYLFIQGWEISLILLILIVSIVIIFIKRKKKKE